MEYWEIKYVCMYVAIGCLKSGNSEQNPGTGGQRSLSDPKIDTGSSSC
jgi:hypothetical protein